MTQTENLVQKNNVTIEKQVTYIMEKDNVKIIQQASHHNQDCDSGLKTSKRKEFQLLKQVCLGYPYCHQKSEEYQDYPDKT